MYIVVLIALSGVAVGYVLRRFRFLQRVSVTITLTIAFMLFVLGVSVGENPVIVRGAWRLGGVALAVALAAMLGSALAGWAVWRYVFSDHDGKEVEP